MPVAKMDVARGDKYSDILESTTVQKVHSVHVYIVLIQTMPGWLPSNCLSSAPRAPASAIYLYTHSGTAVVASVRSGSP